MSDLRDLYQEVVIDHGRRPRNFRALDRFTHEAKGFNPLCGDQMSLYMRINAEDVIEDICFTGSGCAISTAAASLMTETLKGKSKAEATQIFDAFHAMLTQQDSLPDSELLGKLAVLAGVREYPTRVKCATLAGHTLMAAMNNSDTPASTE